MTTSNSEKTFTPAGITMNQVDSFADEHIDLFAQQIRHYIEGSLGGDELGNRMRHILRSDAETGQRDAYLATDWITHALTMIGVAMPWAAPVLQVAATRLAKQLVPGFHGEFRFEWTAEGSASVGVVGPRD